MSISPAIVPIDTTSGVPATGAGSSTPLRTMRRRPTRSVISMRAVREKRHAPRMRQALGHDDSANAALLVGVELERAVAERRAVPGLDARALRNRAALIANRRIRVLALSLRERDGAREQERARDDRKTFTHGTSHRQA